MNVEIQQNPAVWDSFVEASPAATNYHRWVWREIIQQTYGHEAYYLSASENGAIRGVLPLIFIKSRLFASCLVSMPFSSYGGMLATSDEAQARLSEKAVELAREIGARHIELRQGAACGLGWRDATPKVTLHVSLPETTDDLWNRFSPKVRKRVRHAKNHGLSISWGGGELVENFYRVFAANMRNLGTPVYPLRWFQSICRLLQAQVRILVLWDGAQPAAAAFLILFRDSVELPWAASTPESRDKFSTLLLYWSLLAWATQHRFRCVDLGRCTPGSGNHEFKRRWASEEMALHWYYWSENGTSTPDLRPENPHYRWATKIWRHLPQGVANWLGPHLVRAIP